MKIAKLWFIVCLAGAFLLAGPAQAAQWHFIHGYSGHVYDHFQENLALPVDINAGSLRVILKPSASVAVHYSIPTVFANGSPTIGGVRYLRAHLLVGNDTVVNVLSVYNGSLLVKTISTSSPLPLLPGEHDIMVDLGKIYYFPRGLALSFNVASGADQLVQYHEVFFFSAGAYFMP